MRGTLLAIGFLFVAILFLSCTSATQSVDPTEIAEIPTQTGDGGTYSPNTSGSTNVCELDENGDCVDTADGSGTITLSTTALDFGLSEVGAMECQTIALPSGVTYAAEIDKANTDQVDGVYQFAVQTTCGTPSQDRVTGSGDMSICYLRNTEGTHTGQIKLVLNADSSSSSAYAYIITTKGQTLSSLFTITAPTEGQIIDERTGHNEGIDTAEGEYLITATGKVNLGLLSVFEEGGSTNIYINSGGVKYKTTFDASTGAFSKQVGVSLTPGIYNITFSLNTNKGSTLEKTISVVVATTPALSIEVRDAAGVSIGSASPTDAPNLFVGLNVSNLAIAGSSQTDMPVTLYDIDFNGTELTTDTEIYYNASWSWCSSDGSGSTSSTYKGFDGTTTLCIPLDAITNLNDGINTITAKAKNALGETSATFTLVLDNNKPVITISKPTTNQLYEAGLDKITISGTVKYFAPLDAASTEAIPDTLSGDTGSYCQPASDTDTDCPASSVKLWFNTVTTNAPIYIYPSYSGAYASLTADQANTYMTGGTAAGQGNCYEITVEDGTTSYSCDVPEGTFSITLDLPSSFTHAASSLYTNILEFQAESLRGHRTIAVTSFQVGETSSKATNGSMGTGSLFTQTLTAGTLGIVESDCGSTETTCVNRAPVMLSVSEGLISRDSDQGKKIIKVVENQLNKNLSFADVANGWMYWPKDENGEIDLEADFKAQYAYTDFDSLSDDWQKTFITQGIHSNIMATKLWSLIRYVRYLRENTDTDCDERPDLCFFEREGDPYTQYNVALDACGEAITTAFVPLQDLRRVLGPIGADTSDIPLLREWPVVAGNNPEFDDFVSGRWIVQSLDLKDNGFIDADVCLVPNDEALNDAYETQGCDADVSQATVPAFWGHFVSYNLVEGGLLGDQSMGPITYSIEDDTIPMVWNLGKVRLKLTDVLQINRKDIGNTWSNQVTLDGNKIHIIDTDELDDLFDSSSMRAKTIQMEAFLGCEDYYKAQFPGYEPPFGCTQNASTNYPFVLEMNCEQCETIYNGLMMQGQSTYMLGVIWQGVIQTFKKMVSCMDTEMINPMISSQFESPPWVWEGSQFSTSFDYEDFNLSANIENADLNVFDGGLTLRLPLSIGVDGVPLQMLAKPLATAFQPGTNTTTITNFLPAELVGGIASKALVGGTISNADQAFVNGHLRRNSSNEGLEDYPLTAGDPQEQAFVGASINLEEIINAASYLIFKKGPLSLLDTFDIEEVEATNNWQAGIDRVVLGRFDICNVAGLIDTALPPSLLFPNIQSLFNESSLHLDLILDKDYPATFSLNSIDGADNSTEVQLGITNLQLGVKELSSEKDADGTPVSNSYINPADKKEILRVRLDGVIKIRLVYHKEQRQVFVFIPGWEEQNIHLSVVPGHGGATYDDVNVVSEILGGVLKPLVDKMGRTYSANLTDPVTDEAVEPTLTITLTGNDDDGAGSLSVADLMDFEFKLNVAAAENASCGDNVPHYSDETTNTEEGDGDDNQDVSSQGTGSITGAMELKPAKLTTLNIDICNMLYPHFFTKAADGKLTQETDPIRDMLCDYGIKNITIDPTLIFDNEAGYIHVSGDLMIELENWLSGEDEE